jgi:hypothetical protein
MHTKFDSKRQKIMVLERIEMGYEDNIKTNHNNVVRNSMNRQSWIIVE